MRPEQILSARWKMPNRRSHVSSKSQERKQRTRKKTYTGITEGKFKSRYHDHTNSIRNPKHKNSTALNKYIWNLKYSKIKYSIEWKIIKQCRTYSSKTKRCSLYLHEKFIIICHPKLGSLNSRNDLVSTCRHRKKHLLCSH